MSWRRLGILNGFLCNFASDNQNPNCEKSLNLLKKWYLLLSGYLNIRSFPHAIFWATCLHFGFKSLPKSRLGGVLGRLGRVLERLGLMWERPVGVLVRLGAYGARMERVFKQLGLVRTAIMLWSRHDPAGIGAPPGPGEAQLSRRRKPYEGNLTQKNNLQRVSVESECREWV